MPQDYTVTKEFISCFSCMNAWTYIYTFITLKSTDKEKVYIFNLEDILRSKAYKFFPEFFSNLIYIYNIMDYLHGNLKALW